MNSNDAKILVKAFLACAVCMGAAYGIGVLLGWF